MHLIDRRLNPGGKSLGNRQRFLRRAKALLRQAVHESSADRGIRDSERGGEVTIPADGVHEPTFHRANSGGVRDHILPGNKEYLEGDEIARPRGGGRGAGSQASPDGDGQDAFRFMLSREEFLDLFLEDLELPNLAKRRLTGGDSRTWQRAGYTPSGPPANLSVARTMRHSLSRRIALHRPKPREIAELREAIAREEAGEADPDKLLAWRAELEHLLRRSERVAFIDPIDVRYRRFQSVPKPIAQAVMFCLMDVSGSMTEHMKDVAKRFFTLLYIFLRRRYEHVEIVFIQHTHKAREVDEETFFGGQETGGTIVSTALEEMARVVKERYPPEDWNIYAAQASDGDNMSSDNARTVALLTGAILPVCQYYAYLEVSQEGGVAPISSHARHSELWRLYSRVSGGATPFAMRRISHRRDIYPVFRELFERQPAGAGAT